MSRRTLNIKAAVATRAHNCPSRARSASTCPFGIAAVTADYGGKVSARRKT